MSTELKPFGYPVSWIHDASLLEVPPLASHLLEHYASIPPSNQILHINAVRSQALKTYPYPCLGHYRFLTLHLALSPSYPLIASVLTRGATFLDLGCCIGQELRYLSSTIPGLSGTQLYGADIEPAFFEVGYELFRDRETFKGTFLQADIFDEGEGAALTGLRGKVDIIWTASVLHLWGWEKQVRALRVMFKLLDSAEEPVLAGRMMGFSEAGDYVFESRGKEESFYRHNGESFRNMFREASAGFDGWDVEVEAPMWEETLKIQTAEEPGTTWDLQVKFVARRGKGKTVG